MIGCRKSSAPPSGDNEPSAAFARASDEEVGNDGRSTVRHHGPLESLRDMRAARAARRLDRVRAYLPDEAADSAIEQLTAIGRLHRAAGSLRARVEERYGLAAAQEFDFRAIDQLLGPLCPSARLLDETATGDRAIVVYQLADRLPNRTAEMVRVEGRWRLAVHPIDGLPAAIERLASLLRRMTREIDTRRLELVAFRKELAIRRQPILRSIQRLVEDATRSARDEGDHREPPDS